MAKLPDARTIEWMFETWKWLLEGLGGFACFQEKAFLSTPTPEDFPVTPANGPARARPSPNQRCEGVACETRHY
jgi:hypothetical protein